MQFYQKRTFGTIISDTFTFFKENGKNYFKNYILINGLLLILMVVIFVFGYRELLSQMLGSNINGQNYYFQTYFEENRVLLAVITLLGFILFVLLSAISYSYPILYLKRLSETGNNTIKSDEMLRDIKNNFGRFLKLFLGLVFIVMPLSFLAIAFSYVLVFLFIGFFLLFLIFPALLNVINFLMFDYFNTQKGFFGSLSYALRAQFSYRNGNEKSPFWKYWGSTVIMFIIVQVSMSVFTALPMIFLGVKMYAVQQVNGVQQNPFEGTLGIFFFGIYGVSILMSFLLMNVIFVSSGLQYYDSRTDLHTKVGLTEIDTIGVYEV